MIAEKRVTEGTQTKNLFTNVWHLMIHCRGHMYHILTVKLVQFIDLISSENASLAFFLQVKYMLQACISKEDATNNQNKTINHADQNDRNMKKSHQQCFTKFQIFNAHASYTVGQSPTPPPPVMGYSKLNYQR